MSPILLVTDSNKSTKKYLKGFKEEQGIKAVNTFEIEPKNKEISIDQIREIKSEVSYSFSESRLFVLHRFDSASYQAQNAFLKTLEEHNENIYFVLVVESPYDILPTIRSRCKILNIKVLDDSAAIEDPVRTDLEKLVAGRSKLIFSYPGFQVSNSPDALDLIDQMILFFRKRFENDQRASEAVKALFSARSLILKNNVSPQFAMDHALINIQKKYSHQ